MRNRSRYATLVVLIASPFSAVSAQSNPLTSAADSAFAVGGYEIAAKLYRQILDREPNNFSAHLRAGYADLALKQDKSAKQHFDAVVGSAPASGAPLAQGGLAISLARLGAHDESIARLENAVAAGYTQVDIIDREKSFETLRTNPRFMAARKRAESNAFPCQSDSTSRSFDFWVGEWDVYLSGGNRRVGSSRVERVSGSCAILEHWTGLTSELIPPSTGESLNFPDPVTGEWRQVWMGSARGQNDFEHGRYVDGAMRFTFARTDPQGRSVTGRFMFFNLGPNRVRQFQESSVDGGRTYQTVYDFTYVRRTR